MKVSEKIEEIRKKPEHIRMRYVWAGVTITMFFVFVIWLFSMQEIFKKNVPQPSEAESFQNQWNQAKDSMPSIQDFLQENSESLENEIGPQIESQNSEEAPGENTNENATE